jgi:hypothetical protein
MILENHRDVRRLSALLFCQAFFASEPLEGLRIGHSHIVFSFRVMFDPSLERTCNILTEEHVMLHSPAVCIGRKVETVTWKLRAQSTIVRSVP